MNYPTTLQPTATCLKIPKFKIFVLLINRYFSRLDILYTSNHLKLLGIVPRVLPSLILSNQLITSFQILEVFTLVGQTLKKELIQFLDRVANDVYMTSTLPRFPYKSFGESIHLVMISMMRELLSSKKGLFNFP